MMRTKAKLTKMGVQEVEGQCEGKSDLNAKAWWTMVDDSDEEDFVLAEVEKKGPFIESLRSTQERLQLKDPKIDPAELNISQIFLAT